MAGAEDGEVGFEEGMPWLPSKVLDEAFSDITNSNNYNKRHVKNQQYRHHHRRRHKLPADHQTAVLPQHSKTSSSASVHRQKHHAIWGSRAGSGMQAIFLESAGHKPCGTGVFLPQTAGSNFQPTRKAACSPVLLPSRVVQALNLNVHEIGLRISSPRKASEAKNTSSGNNDLFQISSPEIFLPKEWTY